MARHFPASSDAKVTQVTYAVVLRNNVPMAGNPDWVLAGELLPIFSLAFTFTPSYDGGGVLSVDYGSFDQDAIEGMLASLLNGGRTAFGVTLADWQANIMVSRSWVFMPSQQGSVFSVSAADVMSYTAS